eukprot:scaffold197550_cov31-Tisochrysis_lutea.AAC.4
MPVKAAHESLHRPSSHSLIATPEMKQHVRSMLLRHARASQRDSGKVDGRYDRSQHQPQQPTRAVLDVDEEYDGGEEELAQHIDRLPIKHAAVPRNALAAHVRRHAQNDEEEEERHEHGPQDEERDKEGVQAYERVVALATLDGELSEQV